MPLPLLTRPSVLRITHFPIPDEIDPSEGEGAARVSLSEACAAVLDELGKAAADLKAIRHRLRQREVPGDMKDSDVNEEDLPPPAEHARKVAADLETYAPALRNASGEAGHRPD